MKKLATIVNTNPNAQKINFWNINFNLYLMNPKNLSFWNVEQFTE